MVTSLRKTIHVVAPIALARRTALPVLIALLAAGNPAAAQTPPEDALTHLPALNVNAGGARLHDVKSESERVGPANQPEWTTRRAFAETDIYVIPTGEIEFNQFYVLSHPRRGKAEHSFETELEFGLPWRTQLDVEQSLVLEDRRFRGESTFVELPHALADWGKLPLNPAIGPGWHFRNGKSDAAVLRLLLADEFKARWHFGANIGVEREQQGGETEIELNAALTYAARDRRLAIGAELVVEGDDEEREVLAGPILLYKPTRDTHWGLVSLFGVTHDSPRAEIFVIFGFDLEPFSRRASGPAPRPGSAPLRRRN